MNIKHTENFYTIFHNTEIKVEQLGTTCSKKLTFFHTVHYTHVMKTDDSAVGMLCHLLLQVFTD